LQVLNTKLIVAFYPFLVYSLSYGSEAVDNNQFRILCITNSLLPQ